VATFTKVEILSEYPGGQAAWLRYLNKTLRYPDKAVDKNIMGTVIVQFTVDTDGKQVRSIRRVPIVFKLVNGN
jgi:protein TonB